MFPNAWRLLLKAGVRWSRLARVSALGRDDTESPAYRFLKFGGRFSMKAAMPSFWSSVANSG
jgi:hypothetical protein